MIKETTILEYLFTQQQRKKIDKQSRDLKAREEKLEAEMIAALEGKQRVEVGGYRLAIEKFIKTFRPSYKTCAIELAGEIPVIAWCDANDPQEEGKRLIVELRPKTAKAV